MPRCARNHEGRAMPSDALQATPIRKSILLRQQMQDAIDSEIAERIKRHQDKIARLRTAHAAMAAAAAPVTEPLVMLAQGDSWFDYPLDGNAVSLSSTDIIAHLQGTGATNPVIANLAHWGETSVQEMSLSKQERMIQALQDPANWLSRGKPDAILFSAGGNDIAGEQFCIYLDSAATSASSFDLQRLREALGMIEASYNDLFAFRDQYAPGVPVWSHCYDFPLPTGAHPACISPWLQPSLNFAGWNFTQKTAICQMALTEFKAMLIRLAGDAANLFFFVDTQGTLAASDWANELHPFPAGFNKLAAKFVTALQGIFPGRI